MKENVLILVFVALEQGRKRTVNHSFYFLILYMYGSFTCMCLCTTYVPSACREQKRSSDPMELELLTIVCHHVGAWKLNQNPLKELQVLFSLIPWKNYIT